MTQDFQVVAVQHKAHETVAVLTLCAMRGHETAEMTISARAVASYPLGRRVTIRMTPR